jgi:hypothetical protein
MCMCVYVCVCVCFPAHQRFQLTVCTMTIQTRTTTSHRQAVTVGHVRSHSLVCKQVGSLHVPSRQSDHKARISRRVQNIHARSRVNQHAYHIHGPDFRSQEQRSHFETQSPRLHVLTQREDVAHHVRIVAQNRHMKRRVAIVCARAYIGVEAQQKHNGINLARAAGRMQRSLSKPAPNQVNFLAPEAPSKQLLERLDVALSSCFVYGRGSAFSQTT